MSASLVWRLAYTTAVITKTSFSETLKIYTEQKYGGIKFARSASKI